MSGIFHWNEGIIHDGGVMGKKDASVSGTITWRLNNLESLTATTHNKLDAVVSGIGDLSGGNIDGTSGTHTRLDTVATKQDTQITHLTEIRDYLDTVETKLAQMISDLGTYEGNRDTDADLLNDKIGEVQASPTANTLLDRVLQVKNAVDSLNTNLGTYEGNRNTDADLANTRLTEVRDYLDTVETQLGTLITNLSTYEGNRNTDQDLANTKLDTIHADLIAPTPSGTNIIGRVGIDQTANGTTNRVFVDNFPQVQAQVVTGGSIDMRGQTRVAGKTVQLHNSGKYPASALRTVNTVTNGGTISKTNSEIYVSTSSNPASSAITETIGRGLYICGLTGCFDMSGRVEGTPTGSASIFWGYMDANDGYGYGMDATGVFIFLRKAGVNTKVYQTDWNTDQLDGTGPSGLTLDITKGHIFNIEYNWFGYGTAEYGFFLPSTIDRAKKVIVHIDRPAQATQRTNTPNLPIRIEVNNNGSTNPLSFVFGGYSFSLIGDEEAEIRTQYHPRTGVAFGNNTNLVYIMSIRHKTTSDFEAIRCKLDTIKTLVTSDVIIEIRTGVQLTGASFGPSANQSASEQACEVDTSATAFTGGTVIYGDIVTAGGGGNATGGTGTSLGGITIPYGQTMTILARLKTAANAQTIDTLARWTEEW